MFEQINLKFLRPYNIDFIIGRMLTLSEALGLKDSQEKSYKDLIRSELWNFYHQDLIEVPDEVKKFYDEWCEKNNNNPTPSIKNS